MQIDERASRQILGQLVAGRPVHPIRPSSSEWSALFGVARWERVVPALAFAVREDVIVVDADKQQQIETAWVESMQLCVRLEARLVWLAARLADLGIELRALKGPASAHLDHERPERRQFGDIDVLIRSGDFVRVLDVLRAEGYTRRYPEPRAGFDERFTKSVCMVGDIEIDVHRTLAEGPIGFRIPSAALWRDAERFSLGGSQLDALGVTGRLLHACLHAELAPPPARLSSLSDVVAILRRSQANSADVRATAREWGIEQALDSAIGSSVRVGAWDEVSRDPGWLGERGLTVLDAALFASHRDPRSSWGLRAALGVATLPNWRTRTRYVRALAAPRRGYVTSRHASRRVRWAHAGRLLRRSFVASVRSNGN